MSRPALLEEPLLTYADVSEMLGIPRSTIAVWVHRKEIPHIRLGKRTVRFLRSDLAEWMSRRRQTGS